MEAYGADSEVLQKVKQELGEIAAELNRMVQTDCGQVLKNLSVCWKGENAETYCKKLEGFSERLVNTAKGISGIGLLK